MIPTDGLLVYGSEGLFVYGIAAALGVVAFIALGLWGLTSDEGQWHDSASLEADKRVAIVDRPLYKKAA